MICKSSLSIRPVYSFIDNNFRTSWHNLSADGENVFYDGLRISSEHLTNYSPILGVVCYGTMLNGVLTIFDFSSSHLCRMQFLRLKNEIIREWNSHDQS